MSAPPTFNNYTVPASQVFLVNEAVQPDPTGTGDLYYGGYPSDTGQWIGLDGTPIQSFTFNTDATTGNIDVMVTTQGSSTPEMYATVAPEGDQSTSAIALNGLTSASGGSIIEGTTIVLSNTTLTPTQDGSGFVADLPKDGQQFSTSVSCFATGTMILTSEGEVAVENLKVGDLAITSSGEARKIRWIGHRHFKCRGFPQVNDVWPVHIQAGAFGPNLPNRDLQVSPGHGVGVNVLDEMLIPAVLLINGATIRQLPVDAITYYHVELETPDMIMANGLPAESYIDVGNRSSFISADSNVASLAFTEIPPAGIEWARPKVFDQCTIVRAVKERLAARAMAAGWTLGNNLESFHAIVDGLTMQPVMHEGKARFLIPASAKDVRLVATTSAPNVIEGTADGRPLGVAIDALVIDDALTGRREIALDDPRLKGGFHGVEQGHKGIFRWTSGEVQLPASLWEGCLGHFFLQLGLLSGRPCWVAPAAQESASKAPLQLVSGL